LNQAGLVRENKRISPVFLFPGVACSGRGCQVRVWQLQLGSLGSPGAGFVVKFVSDWLPDTYAWVCVVMKADSGFKAPVSSALFH
jgi:hypothetical protein